MGMERNSTRAEINDGLVGRPWSKARRAVMRDDREETVYQVARGGGFEIKGHKWTLLKILAENN